MCVTQKNSVAGYVSSKHLVLPENVHPRIPWLKKRPFLDHLTAILLGAPEIDTHFSQILPG